MKATSYIKFLPAIALIAFSACGEAAETENGNDNDNSRERVVAVETLTLEPVSFDDRIRINGNVSAHDDALIAVETPGQILFIAERGTQVNRGDVILRIDDRLLRANYEAAKTGFDLAEDVYNRQAALYADSVISTVQYLQSRSQRDQARAQLTAIDKQLNDAQLRAPFSGRIEERLTTVGQFAGPGTPVLRLVNTSKVKVTGGVPERFSGLITQGSAVDIHFRNYNIPSQSATVRFAGNLVNPDSRTFPIEVILDNPTGSIKPLMVVDMQVMRQQISDQIVIPRTSVVRDESGNSVYVVVNNDGVARATVRSIEISLSSGDFVVVESGLEAGDEVIISGLTTIGEGDRLNIVGTKTSQTILQR